MQGLEELKAENERAEARELAELRADTVKGLRWAFETGNIGSVETLLSEAGVLSPLFDLIIDRHRVENRSTYE
ncbi:hypothetical protein LCGC14_0294790 [marine sediment metagenome]|uniref:Uncharacterized protein n=1 Tax=marine sediment metagenome TaxID=412755 RepID=A0A0F9WDC9_9ZZZZ